MKRMVLTVVFLLVVSGTITAQIIRDSVAELQGIDVVEHLGQKVPMDVRFTDDRGRDVVLGDYFGNGKPVVLVLAYYECPMLCNLVLNGLTEAIKSGEWQPGQDYEIVTVSINPLETSQLAAAKKKNYIRGLEEFPSADAGWHFLVGEESQARGLADAVGFEYYYVPEREEYAHPAVIFLLAEDGTITRYLYGIDFKSQDYKLALLEASEGKIGSTLDRLILYCYHYDPDSKGYTVLAGNVMRLGGIVTILVMSVFLGVLWARDRHRRHEKRAVYRVSKV